MNNQTTITRVKRPGIMWVSAEKYAQEHGIVLVDQLCDACGGAIGPIAYKLRADYHNTGSVAWINRRFCSHKCVSGPRHYLGNATNRTSGRE